MGELKAALANVKALSGLLPICARCKKIRDDKGYWNQIESTSVIGLKQRSHMEFVRSAPPCTTEKYTDVLRLRAVRRDSESARRLLLA